MGNGFTFHFENLDMYRLAVGVARWVHRTEWPRGFSSLKDQGVRASQSVALNIAEGRLYEGKMRRKHYRIALASAGEVLAVLDLLKLAEAEARREELRRIGAMLNACLR